MVEIPNKEEWSVWKISKTTRFLLQALYNKREQLKEGMAEAQDANFQNVIGQCMAVKDAIQYITKDFEYLERDSEYAEELEASRT